MFENRKLNTFTQKKDLIFSNMLLIVSEHAEHGRLDQFLIDRKLNFNNQLTCSDGSNQKVYNFNNGEQERISDDMQALCTLDLLSYGYQIAIAMKFLADSRVRILLKFSGRVY